MQMAALDLWNQDPNTHTANVNNMEIRYDAKPCFIKRSIVHDKLLKLPNRPEDTVFQRFLFRHLAHEMELIELHIVCYTNFRSGRGSADDHRPLLEHK